MDTTMRKTAGVILFSVLALGVAVIPASAQEKPKTLETGTPQEKAATEKMPATLPDIWSSIEMHQKSLHQVVTDKKPVDAPTHAAALSDLVASLPSKSTTLTPEKKSTLDKSVSRVKSLAAEIDKAGKSGDATKMSALANKIDTELKGIQGLYGASDLKPAPPEEALKQKYTCFMHPEVQSDQPGACLKCGMALAVVKDPTVTAPGKR